MGQTIVFVEFTNGTTDWLSWAGFLYFTRRGTVARFIASHTIGGEDGR